MKDFESILVNVAESDFGPLLTAVTMLNQEHNKAENFGIVLPVGIVMPVCAVAIERKIPANEEKGSEQCIVCNIHYQDPVVLFSLGQLHGMVVTKTKS